MKINYLLALSLNLLIFTKLIAQSTRIEGNWRAKELDQSIINIQKNTEGILEGIVKSSDDTQMIGKKILYGFKYDNEDAIYKGKIYSYKRKMELDGALKLESNVILKVTGKKLFISKTFLWERVKE